MSSIYLTRSRKRENKICFNDIYEINNIYYFEYNIILVYIPLRLCNNEECNF